MFPGPRPSFLFQASAVSCDDAVAPVSWQERKCCGMSIQGRIYCRCPSFADFDGAGCASVGAFLASSRTTRRVFLSSFIQSEATSDELPVDDRPSQTQADSSAAEDSSARDDAAFFFGPIPSLMFPCVPTPYVCQASAASRDDAVAPVSWQVGDAGQYALKGNVVARSSKEESTVDVHPSPTLSEPDVPPTRTAPDVPVLVPFLHLVQR